MGVCKPQPGPCPLCTDRAAARPRYPRAGQEFRWFIEGEGPKEHITVSAFQIWAWGSQGSP